MIATVGFIAALFVSPPGRTLGIATTFATTAVDPWNPRDELACRQPDGHRRLAVEDRIVAHRSLPCGARVRVCVLRTGKCAEATVGDRGPRHALVDLAPAVARELGYGHRGGFNGMEMVSLDALNSQEKRP